MSRHGSADETKMPAASSTADRGDIRLIESARQDRADDAAEHRAGADEAVEPLRLRHRVGATEQRPDLHHRPRPEEPGPHVERVEHGGRRLCRRASASRSTVVMTAATTSEPATPHLLSARAALICDRPSARTTMTRYIHGSRDAGIFARKNASRAVSSSVCPVVMHEQRRERCERVASLSLADVEEAPQRAHRSSTPA